MGTESISVLTVVLRNALRKSERSGYIHLNPVKDQIVVMPEDYYFSSARNYAGLENDLEVILLSLF
ncbi:hypothetical protein V8245_04090 [Flavobacterium columnare]|uniref:Uncharacterized protein n=1 Tax=Flavobacterium columnare (strain ATCC 49512 / CIP 103533 / TG 44/87) TaxID=1041826 RepID=G8XAI5_FLACA|nr:hypothetical protein [Flavobacterium columnare]AEW86656.1 hypothetical protein FCOL_09235 [Flavobacterium columnare ATCC 49512]AUX18518.1 hypothetical protein AQ623_09715 [Flavobacterium columnare]OOB82336.1 hypothetical protein BZL53_11040 [Flavobacterium columnare]